MERIDSDTWLVSPEGDIDMAASERLRAALRTCWLGSAARLVVDLSRVDLFDASGVRTLLEGRDEMEARGGRLILVRPSAAVQKVLEVTETISAFRIVASREALGVPG